MIWLPTLDQVLELHALLVERTGGALDVRDVGLVESAIMRADASYGGVELYDALPLKAAVVCCGLVGNHGFIDGNKRVGVAALLLILRKNGLRIAYTQNELVDLGLSIARGELRAQGVAEWIEAHKEES